MFQYLDEDETAIVIDAMEERFTKIIYFIRLFIEYYFSFIYLFICLFIYLFIYLIIIKDI